MSLRVWLPLTGHLNNQGLSDLTFVPVGTTTVVDNNGKLGKCYSNSSNTAGGLISDKAIDLGTTVSMCCWFKYTSLEASANLGGGLVAQHCYTDNTGLGITIKYVSSTTGYISCSTGTGSSRTYNTYCGTTLLQANTWYHAALTYDGTTIRLYLNGVMEKSVTYAQKNKNNQIGIFAWSVNGGAIHGDYKLKGSLNDVRIYDHALSPKEIKLLSQGLVCHYTLGDSYLEGTTNLCTTSDCLSSTCYNGATGKYGYGTNTDIYKTTGIFNGKLCTKVYMGTSGNSARPYPYVSNMFVSNGTNQPKNKTISFDYYGTIGTYINPYKLGSGSATCDWRNNATATKSGTFTNSGAIPVVPNMWNHISFTLTGTTDANAEWGYIILGDTHTSDTSNYWLFANFQIEAKDHETGYAGVGGTRNETTVYDCSGFGHNGTIFGELTTSSDTPKNSISAAFNGTEYITANTLNGEIRTISAWFKTTKNKTTSQFICASSKDNLCISLYNGAIISFFGTSPGAGSKCALGNEYKENDWNHVVVVYTGVNTRDVYCNGVKLTPTTNDYWSPAGGLFISCRNTSGNLPFYGNISDVRIYATALSADDILELYHTSASIDKDGNLYAYEFKEE